MNKQEEQIAELNTTVTCTIAPSPIHGAGVFAIRDISKGKQLYCYPKDRIIRMYSLPYGSRNKLLPEVRDLILQRWASWVNGSQFSHPHSDAWLILFMNHSGEPNYDPATDQALRDIQKGEEITEDYRRMVNYELVFPWLKS